MTDNRLRELRGLVRRGELPADLAEELRLVVGRLVRLRLLPPMFAPYGVWDDEAVSEVFADWYTERLLSRGHLQMLLDRARTPASFRRLAERSLRQHLFGTSARSQRSNLFRRVVELLEESNGEFVVVRDSTHVQDRFWRLADDTEASEWAGDDSRLLGEAWALGEFAIVRYRADAKKLAPVLSHEELHRFVTGLFRRAGAALSPRLLIGVLETRFDLGEIVLGQLDDSGDAKPSTTDFVEALALGEVAETILVELTPRQLEVLRRSDGETIDAMVEALGCSVGTIVNEQRRIAALIARFVDSDDERTKLVRMIADRLYDRSDTND